MCYFKGQKKDGKMLYRYYENLEQYLRPNEALIIYGPRQVGKTTLLKYFLSRTHLKYKLDSGDNIRTQQLLSSKDFTKILGYAEGYELIAIDEAQQIPEIGMALKILIDQMPNLFVIATGSSSFDLSQTIGEPLTGRKKTLILYPLAQIELLKNYNQHEIREKLENFLIFGSYPKVLTASLREEKIRILNELVDSYLLKDVLSLDKIRKSNVLFNLIKLLAFQIGQLVSCSELASQLHVDTKTVDRYLDLLEKSFVIYKLGSFSRNLRKEITSKQKYYFFDLGIRNAVISQFNALDNRNDLGHLWENFIFIERLKKSNYEGFYGSRYFWRTYNNLEIDLIEELDNQLSAYEIKWSAEKKNKAALLWQEHYPKASVQTITSKNYLAYVS